MNCVSPCSRYRKNICAERRTSSVESRMRLPRIFSFLFLQNKPVWGVAATVWAGFALFLLFIAPVKAGARLILDEKGLRGAVGLMIWGLREQMDFSAGRDAAGALRLTAAFRGKKLPLPERKGDAGRILRLLGLLIKSNGKEAALRKLVRVDTLSVALRLGGGDAAALALGAGALRAVGNALPFLRFQCVPALNGKTALRAACIAETRLGILVVALCLWKKG